MLYRPAPLRSFLFLILMAPSLVFGQSLSSLDLGLYPASRSLSAELEHLWKIHRSGSMATYTKLQVGRWPEMPEYIPFLLTSSVSRKPRLRVPNYIGQPQLFPSMGEVLRPFEEQQNTSIPADTTLSMEEARSVLAAKRLAHLRQTKTYRKSRSWVRAALEKDLTMEMRYAQFLDQTLVEEPLFTVPLQGATAALRQSELEAAQATLPAESYVRLRIVGNRLSVNIINTLSDLPPESIQAMPDYANQKGSGRLNVSAAIEAARLVKEIPTPKSGSVNRMINDEEMTEVAMFLGVTTSNVLRSARYRAAMNHVKSVGERLVSQDPELSGRLQRLATETEAAAAAASNKIVTTLHDLSWDQRLRLLAARILPKSAAMREQLNAIRYSQRLTPSVEASAKFQVLRGLTLVWIASILAIDVVHTYDKAGTTFSQDEIARSVFRTLKDLGIGVGLFALRANPAVWVGTAVSLGFDAGHKWIYPDLVTAGDLGDILTDTATEGYSAVRKMLAASQHQNIWMSEWSAMRRKHFESLQFASLPALENISSGSQKIEKLLYRFDIPSFSKEVAPYVDRAKQGDLEARSYMDRLISAYASMYVQFTLATMQFLGTTHLNRAISLTTPIVSGQLLGREMGDAEKILALLHTEVLSFMSIVQGIDVQLNMNERQISLNEKSLLSERVVQLLYELKNCAELGEDGELHAQEPCHPTAAQLTAIEALENVYHAIEAELSAPWLQQLH